MKNFLIIILSLLLLSCGEGKVNEVDNNLIFKIGKNKVYLNEFLFYLKNNYQMALEEKDNIVLSKILDDFIESRILIYDLREKNLHPTPSEITEFIKLTGHDKEVALFDINLKRMYALHISFIIGEEKLKNYLEEKLPKISKKEISDYYEKHIEEYIKEKSYCFIRFYSSHKDLLSDARYWLVKKRKDEKFIKLRYQDIKVDDEQCFTESELPEVFLEVLQKTKKNKITKIIETTLGKTKAYNMFLLKKINKQKKVPLNEEYENIEKKVKEEKLENSIKMYKKNLLKKYKVKIYPENLIIMEYKGKFHLEEK